MIVRFWFEFNIWLLQNDDILETFYTCLAASEHAVQCYKLFGILSMQV